MKLETPDLVYQNTRSATYACEYHIIWCTKYRRTGTLSAEIQDRFKELVLHSQENYGYIVRKVSKCQVSTEPKPSK